MARTRGLIAILLIAVGLVWVGQGLGLLRGQSFMVDDIRWAWFGGVLILAGIGLAIAGRRSRAR